MNQEIVKTLVKKYGKQNLPAIKPGDTIRVYEKIQEKNKDRLQMFEGLVIARKHGSTLDGSFSVRKISTGNIAVVKTFPIHAPSILKIERIKSAQVRRAKLYYMLDRYGKATRFKKEVANPAVWEEKGAEKELEKIAEETAELAEAAAEEKEEGKEDEEKNGEEGKEGKSQEQ